MGNTGGAGGKNGSAGGAGACGGGAGGAGGTYGFSGDAGAFSGGACGAEGRRQKFAPTFVPNLADTVIVTGCNGMKEKKFVEIMMDYGKIKIHDNGDHSACFIPEKGIGIVKYEDPFMAANAIKKLHEQNVHGGIMHVLTADELFKIIEQLNGHHTGTARRPLIQNVECYRGNVHGREGASIAGDGSDGVMRVLIQGEAGPSSEPGPNGTGRRKVNGGKL